LPGGLLRRLTAWPSWPPESGPVIRPSQRLQDVSYRDLPSATLRLYRFLASHPGSMIDAYAAAVLAGIAVLQASRDLEALYLDHPVDQPSAGRYWIHDLMRFYLRTLAAREDPVDDRNAPLDRHWDYYLVTGLVAGTALANLNIRCRIASCRWLFPICRPGARPGPV
jgi:hypothetical protein